MASSLAQQLSQVRSYNAAQLGNAKSAASVQSASYLFPTHTAASQDLYTLQSLGANGWEEVRQLDNTFSKWDQATSAGELLFGESSRGLDRLMKGKEDNDEIDRAISTFFQLVGGNLLDRSAGKCIEWLVRRFRVHEYNVETVLSAFMPYHETQEFARMLQLVQLKDKSHFSFLLAVQKRAVPLPTSVLMDALLGPLSTTASISTLRWVVGLQSFKELPRFRRLNHALQAFWFSTIIKLCSRLQGSSIGVTLTSASKIRKQTTVRSDEQDQYLSVLLPALVDAASTSQLGMDCQIGGCLALCAIANSFPLSHSVRQSIISSLAEIKTDVAKIRRAILTACACMCSADEDESDVFGVGEPAMLITGKTSQRLTARASVAAVISGMSKSYDMSAFVLHLSAGLCSRVDANSKEDRESAVAELANLLDDSVATTDSVAEKIVCHLLQTSNHSTLDQRPECLAMLASLRQRRSQMMDRAVNQLTSEKSKDESAAVWKVLRSIMAIQAGLSEGTNGAEAASVDTSLWLSLQSSASGMRATALRSMVASIQGQTLLASERSVKEAFIAGLQDNASEVVDAVYQSADVLLLAVDMDDVVVGIKSALEINAGEESSRDLARLHLSFLLELILPSDHCSEVLSWQIFRTILWPRLLITKADRSKAKTLRTLLAQNIASTSSPSSPVLRRVARLVAASRDVVEAGDWSRANVETASALAGDIASESDDVFFTSDVEFLIEAAEEGQETGQAGSLLALLVLYNLLPSVQGNRFTFVALRATHLLQSRVCDWNMTAQLPVAGSTRCSDQLIDAVYSKANSSKTLSRAQAHLLHQLACTIPCPDGMTVTSGPANITALVYSLAMSASFGSPSICSQTLTAVFSKLSDASLAFLASIWTTTTHTDEVRLAALSHAQAFLAAFAVQDTTVRHVDFQTIIPSLLIALKDGETRIRAKALECVACIRDTTTSIEARKQAGSSVEVYGYDSIYGIGQSDELKYLETNDVRQLASALLEARSSFVHDALYANSWLQNNLTVAKGEGKRDAGYKRRILEVLFSHIRCCTNYSARLTLLDALHGVPDASRLSLLLPLIKGVVRAEKSCDLNGDQLDAYTGLLLGAYDALAREALDADEDGCWTLFLEGLESAPAVVQKHVALALRKQVFGLLSEGKQREVFGRLADLVANSTSDLPSEVRNCLAALDLETPSLVAILYGLRSAITSHALQTTRAKKAKSPSTSLDDETWSSAMAVLVEILEARLTRKPTASADLLAELFEDLRLGTELLLSQHSSGQYLMQTSMSNLSASLQLLSTSHHDVPEDAMSSLRVDTVVNVIKTPCNPQTFQQALLLLSTLGRIAPEVVLHNAMPVFTFVGSTMLQRDDDYSFVVIEKTLQSILPPVMKNMTAKTDAKGGVELLQASRSLLCVFTDAAKHVPRHRRVPFFHSLISVMGDEYLAPICMLLTDRYASKVSKQEDLRDIQSTLQLPLALFIKRSDAPLQSWRALNAIWDEIQRNWSHRSKDALELQEHVFLDCVGGLNMEHEGRQVSPIKRILALSRFIHLAVVSNADELEEQSLQMQESGQSKNEEQRSLMWAFIEHALFMSQVDNAAVSRAARDSLEEMMKITPANIFFDVTYKLLDSANANDKRSGLHLCCKSILNMSDKEREKASSYTPRIIDMCYSILTTDDTLAEEALDTLLAVAEECVPSEHPGLSIGLSKLVTLTRQSKGALQEQALAVLLSLSKHLGPRLIPHLSSLVSLSLDSLSDTGLGRTITAAVLRLLTSLVRSIPVFVASHIDPILCRFIAQPALQEHSDSAKLLSAIVRSVAAPQLLSTIFSVWEKGDKASLTLHTTCLGLLERTVKNADKRSIMASYKSIFRHLAGVFDARRMRILAPEQWALSNADLAVVEDRAVSVFLKLVLKVNDSTFRPLFLRICDWAMLDLAGEEEEEEEEEGKGSHDEVVARKIVLFKIMNALLSQLGELVTNYYQNILDGAVDVLQGTEKAQPVDEELWRQVMISLDQSASADRGRGSFWNENRFKAVMPSLVAQVTADVVKRSNACESLLANAIASLCQTVPEEACLKLANNALLERTRSSQTKVKVTTIRALERVWKSKECEDTLLGLVPETVPSIAELLQESEAVVQEELSNFVAAVELVLGEGLDGYLQ